MTDKPTIAILGGTGHEGTGLALRWATAGYDVIIGSRKEDKALKVTAEMNEILGKELIRGMENGQAAREADINVLTVVATAHEAALTGLKDDLQGKILVDATARITFPNPKPPDPPSAASSVPQATASNAMTRRRERRFITGSSDSVWFRG